MHYDVCIVGAGASGLMCAISAGKRGRKVILIDHANTAGNKIRISGGGRCNFTNIYTSPANYLSENPHFCVSALKRYTPSDFIQLVEEYGIKHHEKTLGQIFCDGSANQIVDMLLAECRRVNTTIYLKTKVQRIEKQNNVFNIVTKDRKNITSESLVIATGGKSIPKIGATGLGYDIAKKFGLKIIPPYPALVPLTLGDKTIKNIKSLSGISLDVIARCGETHFREGLLFTHRGLSGPVILQISSYWSDGEQITVNLAPDTDVFNKLKSLRTEAPKQNIQNTLQAFLPKRLAKYICEQHNYTGQLADLSNVYLQNITDTITKWDIKPQGTEGFNKAEATRGGVDTEELSSKTFEAKNIQGLYFIGEVIDATGHLGGFNLQWAWSSGHAAGQFA